MDNGDSRKIAFEIYWPLAFWFFLFCFFMCFARFQILICEPQSIWRKVLVQSLLYPRTAVLALSKVLLSNLYSVPIPLCRRYFSCQFFLEGKVKKKRQRERKNVSNRTKQTAIRLPFSKPCEISFGIIVHSVKIYI